ncbi:acyltransferase [Actinomycetota bacterium]
MNLLRIRAGLKALRGQSDLGNLRATGLKFGRDLYLGADVLLDSGHRHLITIGDDVTISDRVHVLAHDASTKRSLGFTRLAPVSIGSRVFVGAGTTILPGVTIGDDVIIGAGSVVSSDLPTGSVAYGVPARPNGRTADLMARRAEEMARSPRWESDRWRVGRGLTPAQADQMVSSIAHSATSVGYLV